MSQLAKDVLKEFMLKLGDAMQDEDIAAIEISGEVLLILAELNLVDGLVMEGDNSYVLLGNREAKLSSTLEGLAFTAYMNPPSSY